MTEKVVQGNIFDSKATIISQQVNNQGVMGSGVAKQVKELYPRVFEKYRSAYEKGYLKLGTCQVVDVDGTKRQFIANLCGQDKYGYDGKRYTSYDAIYTALEKLAKYCLDNKIESVAFPWGMSSDRGGADWNVIITMIESVFKNNENITVEYWKYNV